MAMADYKVRIIARAVVIRYQAGENDLPGILNSYNLSAEDRALVAAQVAAMAPEIPIAS